MAWRSTPWIKRLQAENEKAGAFRPLTYPHNGSGFSRGLLFYADRVRLAPQEIRTYFITAVCAGRRRVFQTTTNAELMIRVIETNREKCRMQIHAFVLMPDHMHLVLTPAPDISLEKAMQFLKGGYSFLLKSKLDVWERSYRERRIVNVDDFATAKQYVELNPVRARMVEVAEDFAFSSAKRKDLVDPFPHGSGASSSGAKARSLAGRCSGA